MESNRAIWLYPRLWVLQMSLREPLAAVLRLTRTARNLSQEDFHGRVEARQMNNIERAKSNPTLSSLEDIAIALDVDLVALVAVASAHDRNQTPKEFLKDLACEITKLEKLGVLDKLDGEFTDGKLQSVHGRVRSGAANRAAVLQCKAEGKTQKETAELLGLAKSTVSKLWKEAKI
ncbi:XRE family transcriptional regulator [Pseudomonas sp. S44]|nr:XRE family transcriptional regulator [Pseudomonas sp. S44]